MLGSGVGLHVSVLTVSLAPAVTQGCHVSTLAGAERSECSDPEHSMGLVFECCTFVRWVQS